MKEILLIICFSFLCCSEPEEPPINTDGYPKIFANQVVIANQIDVYHYKTRTLTYTRTIPIPSIDDRTITLNSQTELEDSQNPTPIEYELINGCIKDWRDYQRITINDNCTLITSSSITIGVNDEIGGNGRTWLTAFFDCEETDSMAIEEAIDIHKQSGRFDSVYLNRQLIELSLVN